MKDNSDKKRENDTPLVVGFQQKEIKTARKDVEISIVVPAFNEEEGLPEFIKVLSAQLERLHRPWEIVFVNDGSTDRTLKVLRQWHETDDRIRIVSFSRNFGHQIALSAGMEYASGKAVIVMDADLQHPPELIPEMIALWEDGHHVVYTVRTYGGDVGWFKRKTSDWFYALCNRISDVEFIPGAADFRLMDRRVVDCFNAMPEKSRFIRGMVRWLGFRQTGLSYKANSRTTGVSKYTFLKMFGFAIDGMTSFSVKPLRWIGYIGFLTALSVIPYGIWAVVYFFTAEDSTFTSGWPSLMVAILFLGGLILVSLGVIGEYIGRIYEETKQRPLFIVQEQYGFSSPVFQETEHMEEKESDSTTDPSKVA